MYLTLYLHVYMSFSLTSGGDNSRHLTLSAVARVLDHMSVEGELELSTNRT